MAADETVRGSLPQIDPCGAVVSETQPPTVRVRVDLAYDGAPFSGWAKQRGLRTIEGCLEQAAELVVREPVRLTVAGRTDAGVHAAHQVLHTDLPADFWTRLEQKQGDQSGEAFVRKLNGALARVLEHDGVRLRPGARPVESGAILVRQAVQVSRSFDARFSVLHRIYRYRIADGREHQSPLLRGLSWSVKEPLDPEVLNAVGESLLGLHDFLSFCRPRPGASTVRELQELCFTRTPDGLVEASVQADAFCHHMVRSLVGACVQVARGQQQLSWLRDRLATPVRDSSIRMAPPEGLVLQHIVYPDEARGWAERAERTRARRGSIVDG